MINFIYILIAGAIGGLLKSLLENQGRVSLPKIEYTDTENYIHFGFLLNVLLGGVVALISASDIPGALAIGMSSAFVGEKIIETLPQINAGVK